MGVPADQLLDGGVRPDLALDEPRPLPFVAQQRQDAVSERVDRRLVAGVEQDDDGGDELRISEAPAFDLDLDQACHEVVLRLPSPLADDAQHVVTELGRCQRGGLGLLERRVELVHLHHRVRPVEQVAPAVGGDAEEPADDRDRVRLGEVAQQIEPAVGQQLVGELRAGAAQRLDRARGERGRHELPDPRVLGRLEPEQAPPLAVPEGLPARVERLGGRELVLRAEVAEVAAQPPVAEARAHIGVARDEPALQ